MLERIEAPAAGLRSAFNKASTDREHSGRPGNPSQRARNIALSEPAAPLDLQAPRSKPEKQAKPAGPSIGTPSLPRSFAGAERMSANEIMASPLMQSVIKRICKL